jgi:D-alanine-D-alanine ligase
VSSTRRSNGRDRVLVLSNDPNYGQPFQQAATEEVDEVAQGVAAALAKRRIEHDTLWLGGSIEPLLEMLKKRRYSAVFNLCEALGGDPRGEILVAQTLACLKVPFSGCGPNALALCLDKGLSKSLLRALGFPVPRYFIVSPWERIPTLPFGWPMIVKPIQEDASIGIHDQSVVRSKAALAEQVETIHSRYHQSAIVEEFVSGREFNISVVGDKVHRALPVSEIDFSGLPAGMPRIVTYEAKWNKSDPRYTGTVPIVPAPLPPAFARRLQKLAVRAGKALGCRHYWRVDFRVSSRTGEPRIVEVNPNPDLHPEAGLARALKVSGVPYATFVKQVVQWTARSASAR